MPKKRKNMTDEELEKWFFEQKTITETGCWEWTGVRIKNGYGMLSVKRIRYLAHRYSLQLFLKRPIIDKLEVRHMCHNPPCINPLHLKEGTHSENMSDMVNANRQAQGEYLSQRLTGIKHTNAAGVKNHKSKLTIEQITEIRSLTIKTKDIAKLFNVSANTIRRVKKL
jgi:DNA-binding transcriptional regulator YiaG